MEDSSTIGVIQGFMTTSEVQEYRESIQAARETIRFMRIGFTGEYEARRRLDEARSLRLWAISYRDKLTREGARVAS